MKRIVAVLLVGLMMHGCGLRTEDPQGKKPSERDRRSGALQKQASSEQQPFVVLAVDLLQKGEIAAAVRALDEAIRTNPRDVQAYALLGQTYMHANELDRAVDTFSAGLNVDPQNGEMHYMLAVSNGLRGQREKAIASAETALRIFEQERDEENFKRALFLLHGLSQE